MLFLVSRLFCLKIYSILTCLDFGCWFLSHFSVFVYSEAFYYDDKCVQLYLYIYIFLHIHDICIYIISCMIRIYVSNAPGTIPLANRRNQSSKSAKRSGCVEHFPTSWLHDSEHRTGLFLV